MFMNTGFTNFFKYQRALEKVRAARPDLKSPIDTYAWHGTRGDYANLIVIGGFDLSHAGKSAGRSLVKIFIIVTYVGEANDT